MDSSDNALEREFSEYASIARIVEFIEKHDSDMLHEFTELSRLAKSSSSTVKELLDVYTSAKNADLHRSITKLDREMAETERLLTAAMREADTLDREKLALERENTRLKEEIEKLKTNSSDIKLVQNENGLYYKNDGEGPFCKYCSEKLGKYVEMSFSTFPDENYRCKEDPHHIGYSK